MKTIIYLPVLIALLGIAPSTDLQAQGNVFTYQGRLSDNNGPLNTNVPITFRLYPAPASGGPVWEETHSSVAVTNGLFVAPLGQSVPVNVTIFNGGARWLGISVNGGPELTPRQPIAAAPYAITAGHLTGVLPANSLNGTYSSPLTFNSAANNFTGSGAGLMNVNAATLGGQSASDFWQTDGNAGTSPGTHFLGTTDNQPLVIKVNGLRTLRLEDNGDSSDLDTLPDGAPNVIGGSPSNFVAAGVVGAVIGGGGATNYSGSPGVNAVLSDFGVISGGMRNRIGTNSLGGAIGGGVNNNIAAHSEYSTIGGGQQNNIAPSSFHATIAGGSFHNIGTNGDESAIGGGFDNNIGANSEYATIAGGLLNDIGADSSSSAIGGGENNNIGTNSLRSTIGGGNNNNIAANSPYAAIPGGELNFATNRAFAAGTRAKANHTGSFVWADSQNSDFASTGNNQFSLRAGGGVRFVTGSPGMTLNGQPVLTGPVTATQLADGAAIGELLDDDGAGSGLDADLLDGLSSSAFWQLGGNAGTTPGTHFLGTTDSQPLEMHVNNQRAFRLEPTANPDTVNIVAGSAANFVAPGIVGATIGGGGSPSFGNTIRLDADYTTIAGGQGNRIEFNSDYAGIGGGFQNSIYTNVSFGTISGGNNNSIQNFSHNSTIAGGEGHTIESSAEYSTISGGRLNTIQQGATHATIPGGRSANANSYGQMAYAGGRFSQNGDAQTSTYVLRRTTTAGTRVEMFLDGLSRRMEMPRNSSWMFDILVVARTTIPANPDTFSAGWRIQGLIDNNNGVTQLEVQPIITGFGSDSRPWGVVPEADNANDALVLFVQGEPSVTIRWVATVRTVEVIY